MLTRNILIGILLGAIFTFSPAGFVVTILFAVSLFMVRRFVNAGSRKFLTAIFVAGFILRVFLAALNYDASLFMRIGSDTQPDARVYNHNALYIASVITGNKYEDEMKKDGILKSGMEIARQKYGGELPASGTYQIGFYVYLIGWIYALLGYVPVAVKILNGLAGCWIAVMTYFTARLLVRSEIAAKIAAAIMMFLPSVLYWSVALLRDTMANLLFLSFVITFLLYFKKDKAVYLTASIALSALLALLKDKLFIFLAALFFCALLFKFTARIIKRKKVRLWIIMGPLAVILIIAAISSHNHISSFFKSKLDIMTSIHLSSGSNPNAATYNLYGNMIRKYDKLNFNLFPFIPRALVYYFLSPFPWHIPYSHGFLLVFYPQMVFNFICLPFVVVGVMASMRKEFFLTLITVLLIALIVVPQAMTEGVIGNVVRHRDMFTPLLIIFASYGFCFIFLRGKQLTGR